MNKIRAWTREPTSVAGLATILGTFTAMLSHQLSWAQAIPLLVGAAVSLVLPDNTGARVSAVALAGAVVTTITTEKEKT